MSRLTTRTTAALLRAQGVDRPTPPYHLPAWVRRQVLAIEPSVRTVARALRASATAHERAGDEQRSP